MAGSIDEIKDRLTHIQNIMMDDEEDAEIKAAVLTDTIKIWRLIKAFETP